MTENELQAAFAAIRGGDGDAFARMYSDIKQPVFTIAWRILKQREAAEDITQDVFLKLYDAPPDASVKNLRAWIFRMARNLAIDALRTAHITESDTMPETAAESDTEHLDRRLDLEDAIARLPQIEREIITLHLNADLPFREVARVVGLSQPAVYRRYRQALQTLRERLNGGYV